MKEIENTELLVSVIHCWDTSANLEVFDLSRRGEAKKIYAFEEVSGSRIIIKIYLMFSFIVTGYGDVSFNPRRSFLGAMCVGRKIAYHLFSFGTSKSDANVKLVRKSKWHFQYGTQESN